MPFFRVQTKEGKWTNYECTLRMSRRERLLCALLFWLAFSFMPV